MMRISGFSGFFLSTVHHRFGVHSSTGGRCDPPNQRDPFDRSSLLLPLTLPFLALLPWRRRQIQLVVAAHAQPGLFRRIGAPLIR
jgi:hypothetical protein